MGRLDDKVCVITGAARGQGAAEARLFAAEGATVWLTDVLDDEGTAVAEEVGGQYRHLDVRDEAAWSDLIDEVVSTDGQVDVLVNNAGIYTSGRHFEISADDFNQVMDINCTGVFLGMRAASRKMRDAGAGFDCEHQLGRGPEGWHECVRVFHLEVGGARYDQGGCGRERPA